MQLQSIITFSGRARKGSAFDFSAIIVIDRDREATLENAIADDSARRKVVATAIILTVMYLIGVMGNLL